MHDLLVYEFVADFKERRAPLRGTHLSPAWATAANPVRPAS